MMLGHFAKSSFSILNHRWNRWFSFYFLFFGVLLHDMEAAPAVSPWKYWPSSFASFENPAWFSSWHWRWNIQNDTVRQESEKREQSHDFSSNFRSKCIFATLLYQIIRCWISSTSVIMHFSFPFSFWLMSSSLCQQWNQNSRICKK